MTGVAVREGLAIEIRERYSDVAESRWPVSVDPFPDELLSSWLHRLALANGIAPRSFAGVLGLGNGMWSPRLDLHLPRHVAALLADQTGVPREAIIKMSMTGCALIPLLLPRRENAHRNRSTWMQYCPLCLADDEVPYFRRQWRLSSRISCFVHRCSLRDRCPSCRAGIASFDQTELRPQHVCARCSFDLRSAPKTSVNAASRRLERAIADICRIEVAKRSPTIKNLVSRLLHAPVVAEIRRAKRLTSLSTATRIHCFHTLTTRPADWLYSKEEVTVAHRRRAILAAGGHGELIAGFADILERNQESRPSKHSPRSPRDADLPHLLEAYSRFI